MSQILLVRHGQASWGAEDYDVLSDLGERQSFVVGESLAARGVRPDVVVRGSMRRHRQTTEQALVGAGWPADDVLVDEGWDEFDHEQVFAMHPPAYGEGEEMTRAQFQEWFDGAMIRWAGGDYDHDYDESFTAFGDRVDAALRRTAERLEGKETAVVFTSGGAIARVVISLLGGSPHTWAQLNPVTVNSSVTKVVVGRRGMTLVSFNDHSHLEAAGAGFITYR
ncbi:MAG TPA: histidine phosphatase family protein [Nocardioidaceae bacterium]|nr:histidine phosphatase family protein [Nocardioidaceae bacterium]